MSIIECADALRAAAADARARRESAKDEREIGIGLGLETAYRIAINSVLNIDTNKFDHFLN